MFYSDEEQFKSQCGYEIDGFWYPRVTKIVEIKSKPALYHFYANAENFAAGEKIKQKSALEGSRVHEIVEAILLGQKPDVPDDIKPAIQAFGEFILQKNIKIDKNYVEKRLINYDERYAGTLDAIALIDGKLGILDFKTSQEIYRDYNLQTAAYMAAMKDEINDLETRWILRIDQIRQCVKCGAILRPKGGNNKIKIQKGNAFMETCNHQWGPLEGQIELKEFPYWHSDYQAFLAAKKLWEWENEDWLKKIGYL
ncbi:MAG: hypothetical protein ACP5IC_00190 [Minisyncoccia bacterium]